LGRVHHELIINCAVIGVDDCVRDPALAKRVNVDGPANLAEGAARIGAKLAHFSTNYVFDGRPLKRAPYAPGDEALAVNVYGRTKRDGELAVANRCERSFVIRTSWVYGPGKQNFLGTVAAKLRRGESVQAINDTWASTTYVEDLADRVLGIVTGEDYGIHHAVNEGVCSYETFARRAAELAGVPEKIAERLIEVVSETSMSRAPRPVWTPMLCEPPMRSWDEALAAYVT
jgi:dTDP-4-dehydrorhamnose reductase